VQKLADSLTIAVPPSLPASMNFGMIFALARLRRKNIYCIQSGRIPVAARIQTYVFDKTGTLTEEGLCVMGVRVNTKSSMFDAFQSDVPKICPPNLNEAHSSQDPNLLLTEAMASCHAVTWIKVEKKDAKTETSLVGDPLDVQMFLSTGWTLDEENATETIAQRIRPKSGDYELCLLRRFDFNSQVMRASSIVMYSSDNTIRGFVKGAPEKIKELCLSNTVP
jgi:cation-transporting ATPase 13A3/4/5